MFINLPYKGRTKVPGSECGFNNFRELYTSLHQSQDVVLQQYRKKTISVWKSSFHYFNSSYSNSLLSSSFS